MAQQAAGFASLKPAFILKVDIGEVTPIGDVSSGSQLFHVQTTGGTLTTVESYETKVEADIIYGADWLYFDPEKKHARPNVKMIAKTKDGVTFAADWSALTQVQKAHFDLFFGSPDAKPIPWGFTVTDHTFEVGDPKYKFLENRKWVGDMRFHLQHEPRKMSLECRISELVPSHDDC